MLSLLYNLFGALFARAATMPARAGPAPAARSLSLAFTLVLTPVFGAVAGIVGAAGEFRHHTIATTYLLTPARGRVLLAKLAVGGLVGALYAVAAAVVGVPAGHARHRRRGRTGRGARLVAVGRAGRGAVGGHRGRAGHRDRQPGRRARLGC